MQKFKKNWEINKNWQLLFPFFGIIGLIYSGNKLSVLFFKDSILLNIVGTIILFFVLLKLTVFILKKLEKHWIVDQKWKIIKLFMIFGITGTTSLFVTTPIFNAIGLTKENFGDNTFYVILYYVIKFFAILPFYKILLLIFGWIFGEFEFYITFVKKFFNRFMLRQCAK